MWNEFDSNERNRMHEWKYRTAGKKNQQKMKIELNVNDGGASGCAHLKQ